MRIDRRTSMDIFDGWIMGLSIKVQLSMYAIKETSDQPGPLRGLIGIFVYVM